jgi:hypothetical protein
VTVAQGARQAHGRAKTSGEASAPPMRRQRSWINRRRQSHLGGAASFKMKSAASCDAPHPFCFVAGADTAITSRA